MITSNSIPDGDIPSNSKPYDLPLIGHYRVAVHSWGYEKKEEIELILSSKDAKYEKIERVTLVGTGVQNVDFEVRIGYF